MFYNKKYIDGCYPYIFNKSQNKKIIYLNITNTSYIFNLCSVQNEKTNIRRILDGIYDSHTFFTTNYSTKMCSYVDEWNILVYIKQILFRALIAVIVKLLNQIYMLNNIIKNYQNYSSKSYLIKITHVIYILLLKTFCI